MQLLLDLFRQMRHWDAPTKIGFALCWVLLIVLAVLNQIGPDGLRPFTLAGAIGCLIAAQVLVMWGNRHMVTPFTQAQRLYRAGELNAARDVLRDAALHPQQKRPDADALTLLGNIERQLGDLAASEEALRRALAQRPTYHFPLYGIGRTLQVQGAYDEAADALQRALDAGAPDAISVDLAHCYLRLGEVARAQDLLRGPAVPAEAHRQVMRAHILGQAMPAEDILRAGLAFWEAEAERHAETPYGRALRADIHAIQQERHQER